MTAVKLAMSNIAWAPRERRDAYAAMQAFGFRGLEIAPGLLFAGEESVTCPTEQAVRQALAEAAAHDLSFVSMQGLHFASPSAALFGQADARDSFFAALQSCAMLAQRLGIPHLVLGSPKARVIPDGMTRSDAWRLASDLLRNFADKWLAPDQRLGVEPNPAVYGTNFLTGVEEAARFVAECNHPRIGLNFDVGALKVNAQFESIRTLWASSRGLVTHVHLSEPMLAPVGPTSDVELSLGAVGSENACAPWVSIEMRRCEQEPMAAVRVALAVVREAAAGIASCGSSADGK